MLHQQKGQFFLILVLFVTLLTACGNVPSKVATATTSPKVMTAIPAFTQTQTATPSNVGQYSFTDSQGKCIQEGLRADSVKEVTFTPVKLGKSCGVVDTKDEIYGVQTSEFEREIKLNPSASVEQVMNVYTFTPIALWFSPLKGGVQPEKFQKPGPYDFTRGSVQATVNIAKSLAPYITISLLLKDERSHNYEGPQQEVKSGENALNLTNIGNDSSAGDGNVTDIICLEIFVRIQGNKAYTGGGITITNVTLNLANPA